jgi:hypothetical protein
MEHGGAVLVGIASVGLVLIGASGHASVGPLSGALAHHYAHIVLPTIAFVIFSGCVLRDIHRNGLPSFSWHL